MITVEKIADGRFDSGKTYSFTEQGKAFGNIGEWLMFADASHVQDSRVLNRAVRDGWMPGTGIVVDSLDGEPAFSTGSGKTVINPGISAPEGEWTAAFVLGLYGTSNGLRRNIFRSSNVTEGDPDFLGLNIFVGGDNGVSSLRLVTLGGPAINTPIRVSYSGGSGTYRNKTVFAMFTFSEAEGLKLFINGARKAVNAADTRRLTAGSTFQLFPTLEDGLCPEVLLNGRDLSLIPGAVAAVSNFYIDKYNLTPI